MELGFSLQDNNLWNMSRINTFSLVCRLRQCDPLSSYLFCNLYGKTGGYDIIESSKGEIAININGKE